MKYETPQLTVLSSAINAVQSASGSGSKSTTANPLDSTTNKNEIVVGYSDWED
jgi:hypothetical protein